MDQLSGGQVVAPEVDQRVLHSGPKLLYQAGGASQHRGPVLG